MLRGVMHVLEHGPHSRQLIPHALQERAAVHPVIQVVIEVVVDGLEPRLIGVLVIELVVEP
jgi:hypothetical protein